ncbi:MAG: hypothetical protein SGI97_10360 [candidate division Zixibacteria bacterium]|nr:hypothetical protein [candidate division Zixibacteria bacterium]
MTSLAFSLGDHPPTFALGESSRWFHNVIPVRRGEPHEEEDGFQPALE